MLLGTSNGKQTTDEDVNQPNGENHVVVNIDGLESDLATDTLVMSDLKKNVEPDLGKSSIGIIYICAYIYL